MSTIAYDGMSIAADRQATRSNMVRECTKIFKLDNGDIVAFAGTFSHIPVLLDWYKKGCDPETYPKFQDTDDYTDMVVWNKNGIQEYQRHHLPLRFHDRIQAWGSGRDFALAAMECGRDAAGAIQVASKFDCYTGSEVDQYYSLRV